MCEREKARERERNVNFELFEKAETILSYITDQYIWGSKYILCSDEPPI